MVAATSDINTEDFPSGVTEVETGHRRVVGTPGSAAASARGATRPPVSGAASCVLGTTASWCVAGEFRRALTTASHESERAAVVVDVAAGPGRDGRHRRE